MFKIGTSTKFWLVFFVLNILLFLPQYLINITNTNFFPFPPSGASWRDIFKYFLLRPNGDIFRISIDLFVFFTVISLINKWRVWSKMIVALITLLYVCFVAIHIYEAASVKVYAMPPNLYSDLLLVGQVADMMQTTIGTEKIIYGLLIFIAACVFAWGVYRMLIFVSDNSVYWKKLLAKRWFWLVIAVPLLLSVLSQVYFLFTRDTLYKNQYSLRLSTSNAIYYFYEYWGAHRQISNIEQNIKQTDFYRYSNVVLQQKPDVLLIAIEAYGKVLSRLPETKNLYHALLQQCNDTLTKSGLYAASAYSRSPVSGGRSWLAYTTLMYGLQVGNQAQYKFMMNKYRQYPSMVRFFQQQGYTTLRLKTAKDGLTVPPELDLDRFYGFDKWVDFDKIPYKGVLFAGFPSIPEQYAFNYFYYNDIHSLAQPAFLFFITQNSHYPWYEQPILYNNWQDAAKQPDSLTFVADVRDKGAADAVNYFDAIAYQLSYLVRSMAQCERKSVFILVGDHQPAFLTTSDDSFLTPVHIVSRDSLFVNSLQEFCFRKGMVANDSVYMHHEGLFSLLVHCLAKQYSTSVIGTEYLPKGIISN